jgi:hypothetical protein
MFQTRNDDGELLTFPTLAGALNHAQYDRTVWKISFPIGDERVRLIRKGVGLVLRQLSDEVNELKRRN